MRRLLFRINSSPLGMVEIHFLIYLGNGWGEDDVQWTQEGILRWTRHCDLMSSWYGWVQEHKETAQLIFADDQTWGDPELVNLHCFRGSSTSWNWVVGLVGEPSWSSFEHPHFYISIPDWHPVSIAAFPSLGQKFSLGASKAGSFGLMLRTPHLCLTLPLTNGTEGRFLLILGYLRQLHTRGWNAGLFIRLNRSNCQWASGK